MLQDLGVHPGVVLLLLFGLVLVCLVPVWILGKFYRALARIGRELAEIKVILRDRSNQTTSPAP